MIIISVKEMNLYAAISKIYDRGCLKNLFFGSPTTEAVGSDFVTSIEPTALVVGAQTNIWQPFERKYF
jgi:hypothetical protein